MHESGSRAVAKDVTRVFYRYKNNVRGRMLMLDENLKKGLSIFIFLHSFSIFNDFGWTHSKYKGVDREGGWFI